MRPLPRLCPLVLPVTLLALSGARSVAAGEVIDEILIHANSRVVTKSMWDSRVEQTLKDTPTADPAKLEAIRKGALEELVNEALLEDRARDLDLVTTDSEIEEQIKRLKEQNNVSTDADFGRALAASGLTIDRLRDQLRRTLTLQRVVGREVQSKVDLTDDALRAIYEREKETWRVPEKAHLAEILISPDGGGTDERRAKEASDLVKKGTKFEAVVAQYSDGATKDRGGDLGIVTRGDLAPEIDKAVFSLPVGGVTDPIPTRFGWHIVKVLEKIPVTYKPFSEVKADLLKREQETQFQKKLAEYLDKLKTDAVIKVSAEAAPYYTPPVPLAVPSPTPAPSAEKKTKNG